MLAQPAPWFILVAFLCALGPLVIFHELGHYLVARAFGVGAESFSIGFGREVVGWTDRRGTRWKVGWLPLGGYVRFVGDENAASAPIGETAPLQAEANPAAFQTRPVWQQFLIVLAGPAANFILAIAIFTAFFAVLGLPHTPNRVGGVQPGSAAEMAGLQAGDRIDAIGGDRIESFEDIRRFASLRPDERVRIDYDRAGVAHSVEARIGSYVGKDEFGQPYRIGMIGIVQPGERVMEPLPALRLVPEATRYTFGLVGTMVEGLKQILVGERSAKELGGPLKMAQIAGQRASLGLFDFFELVAFFSINLGFINLLPVPMLDGGHLFFYLAEAVRRRPVSAKAQEWAFRGGLALLLALVAFTTVNDLGSLGLWDRLGRLIG